MKLIAEDFLTSVKLRSMVPISQQTFTEESILQLASEEMSTELLPMIMTVRENLYLTYKRVAIQASLDHYAIPERASGNALKDIWLLDSSNKRIRTLGIIDVHGLAITRDGTHTGEPSEFMLRGDEVVVFPTPSLSSGYLEFWYYSRPNEIVKTENCAKITGISTAAGTTTFTVDTDLTGSLSVGDKVDIVSSKSPFLLWAEDSAITAITTTTIAVAATDVQNEVETVEPVTGDYICPARQTNIPMAPEEFHPIWAQMTAIKLLESLGHLAKMQKAQEKLDRMLQNGFKLIANRVESQVKPVVPTGGGIMGAI